MIIVELWYDVCMFEILWDDGFIGCFLYLWLLDSDLVGLYFDIKEWIVDLMVVFVDVVLVEVIIVGDDLRIIWVYDNKVIVFEVGWLWVY